MNNVNQLVQTLLTETKATDIAPYGYCPKCGAKGIGSERRINGNRLCSNKHTYSPASAIKIIHDGETWEQAKERQTFVRSH